MSLEDKLNQFPQWIKNYHFNPNTGYLVTDDYKIQFNYQPFNEILSKLPQLNNNQEIIQAVQNFPEINDAIKDYRGKILLRDAIVYLLQSYLIALKKKGIKQQQIIFPEHLAKPLYDISNQFEMKYGMATGVCYNWYIYNQQADLDNLTLADIRLRWYNTDNQYNQRLFFGATVIGGYFMAKIIKLAYEINTIIQIAPEMQQKVLEKLKKIKQYVDKITSQNNVLTNDLDPKYFYQTLRSYLTGFNNVTFKGVQDGMDKKITSTGGNGGYDPSFQVFERAFDIKFQNQLNMIQVRLKTGMPAKTRNLIKYMEENSKIRQYCQCTKQLTEGFNSVIKAYGYFLKGHSSIIEKFIFKFVPENHKHMAKGVGGQNIMSLINRYKIVEDQMIKNKQK